MTTLPLPTTYKKPLHGRVYSLECSFPWMLRDKAPAHDAYVLERYLSDVYALFLNKLSMFALNAEVMSEESTKLRQLLDEMIKIKVLLSQTK